MLSKLPEEIQLNITKHLYDGVMVDLSNSVVYERLSWCSNIELRHSNRKVYFMSSHTTNKAADNGWCEDGLSVNSFRTDVPSYKRKAKVYMVEWNPQVRT